MKKVLVLFIVTFFTVATFAQEGLSEGMQAKNAGNEAFRTKDYVSAIKNWDNYLKSGEEGVSDDLNTKELYEKSFKYAADDFLSKKDFTSAFSYYQKYLEIGGEEAQNDGKTAYAYAYTASKNDKKDIALSYYQKSIALNYKPDAATLYIADIYKDAGEFEKMKELLVDALKKYPQSSLNKKMASMLTTPMLKDAVEPFNAANELAKNAAVSDPKEYVTNMGKAIVKYEESIPLFEQVLVYDPTNEQARSCIEICKENIQKFEEYKASVKK
jgi:tetratricopeptide (TPR) repeat protein